MKENRRPRLAILAIALWWSSGSIAEAQPPIRIGASASKTGTYAALGQNQLRGYQLCVKHTNEKGGVLGRKLELVVEDDQSKSATAIRIYERLITQEKVDLVLGPYGSPMTEPVANVIEKYRMPMVASTAATDAILKLEFNTVFGGFRVDRDGLQIAHKRVMFQWQDGKKVIVWPEELAPGKPRFPTPPWSQRP